MTIDEWKEKNGFNEEFMEDFLRMVSLFKGKVTRIWEVKDGTSF